MQILIVSLKALSILQFNITVGPQLVHWWINCGPQFTFRIIADKEVGRNSHTAVSAVERRLSKPLGNRGHSDSLIFVERIKTGIQRLKTKKQNSINNLTALKNLLNGFFHDHKEHKNGVNCTFLLNCV